VYAKVEAKDPDDGLARVRLDDVRHTRVTWTPFEPGARSVLFKATEDPKGSGVWFSFRVFDVAGNSAVCDPVITTLGRRTLKPTVQRFTGLPQAEHRVRVVNGRPGLRSIAISVNGTVYRLANLKPGETRRLSVRRSMRPGNTNTFTLVGRGTMGQSAMVMIADID
jgi:hypothetical protein